MKHHAEYEAITSQLHQPVTELVFGTNVYLKIPVSSYSARRLLILVEPMLAPNAPNARIYSTDYIVVTSPTPTGAVRMDQIRHLYLHFTIEPLVYARANSMLRLTPLLKPVDDAPLEYVYKTDVVALVTECLIKAIEARRMETGLVPPQKPTGTRARVDLARYDEELGSYERQAEEMRRKQIDLDMRQGWTLTDYFYDQLVAFEHNPEGLSESIGQMVYGMDVERERHRDEQINFLPVGSGEFVRRAPKTPTGMMLAEKKLFEGDLSGAEEIADKGLADPKQDHAEAMFVKARVILMQGDPETSEADFEDVVKTAKDARTSAWAHVYLGRLYDIKEPAERAAAVKEYKAALTVSEVPQDARAAANTGLKTPFTVPKVKHEADEPLDPSGKAEKDAYKPQ
jgi:tetratricopeptide (TPR) repeat protein